MKRSLYHPVVLLALMGLLASLAACDDDALPAPFEGGTAGDLSADLSAEGGPQKDGVADLPGDAPPHEQGLDLDLTAGPDLDPGSDANNDGSSDGAAPAKVALFGELTGGAGVSTGGSFRLISQVGHPMDTTVLKGGPYTLRLMAVATTK